MTRQGRRLSPGFSALRFGAAVALCVFAAAMAAPGARALSELQREDVPPPPADESEAGIIEREPIPPPVGTPVPMPDPIVIPQDPPSAQVDETEPDEPIPDIHYDVELLPESVRRLRALIMEACLSGEIEQLRPLISIGAHATQFSFGGISSDPIDFLRGLSGDDEGQEILAILYEVLAAGYVRLAEGTPDEVYVWPYFFAVPLEALDKRQRVELFKIVTAGDYEDMKNYGAYIFYRVSISPEGQWLSFVAGD